MAHLRKCVEHGVWLVLLQGVAQPRKDQHPHAHCHAQQQKLSVNISLNISELFMEKAEKNIGPSLTHCTLGLCNLYTYRVIFSLVPPLKVPSTEKSI